MRTLRASRIPAVCAGSRDFFLIPGGVRARDSLSAQMIQSMIHAQLAKMHAALTFIMLGCVVCRERFRPSRTTPLYGLF